jgi:tRNA (uracil-5-)-methyltransferase TRM9
MDSGLVKKLNRLNRRFYRQAAPAFDASRQIPWPGWFKLLSQIRQKYDHSTGLKLLDLGAGNGRFGKFLVEQGITNLLYTAIEPEPYLLEKATANLARLSGKKLLSLDLVEAGLNGALPENEFDLVVGFGLMHHLPGINTRAEILNQAITLTKPRGLIIFSFWRFGDDQSFRDKIIPLNQLPQNLALKTYEPGDYFLDFNHSGHVRYCHSFDETELKQIENLPQTKLANRFDADGKSARLNTYLILEKMP